MAYDAQLVIKEKKGGGGSLNSGGWSNTRIFLFHYYTDTGSFNAWIPPGPGSVTLDFYRHPEYCLHHETQAPVVDVQVDQVKHDRTLWEVTVEYSIRPRDLNPPAEVLDMAPWLEPPRYSWDYLTEEKAVQGALSVEVVGGTANGTVVTDPNDLPRIPILNSAGDPFDEPIMEESFLPVLHIERAVLTYDPLEALQLKNKVNSDVYRGADPGHAIIRNVTASNDYFHSVQFWNERWEIAFNMEERGWKTDILDAGFYHWKNIEGDVVHRPFLDAEGNLVSTPRLLNGQGAELPNTTAGITNSAVYLRFNRKSAIEFGERVP